jgi:hypothetical protein
MICTLSSVTSSVQNSDNSLTVPTLLPTCTLWPTLSRQSRNQRGNSIVRRCQSRFSRPQKLTARRAASSVGSSTDAGPHVRAALDAGLGDDPVTDGGVRIPKEDERIFDQVGHIKAPRTSTVNSPPESTVIVGGVRGLTEKRYSVRFVLMSHSPWDSSKWLGMVQSWIGAIEQDKIGSEFQADIPWRQASKRWDGEEVQPHKDDGSWSGTSAERMCSYTPRRFRGQTSQVGPRFRRCGCRRGSEATRGPPRSSSLVDRRSVQPGEPVSQPSAR